MRSLVATASVLTIGYQAYGQPGRGWRWAYPSCPISHFPPPLSASLPPNACMTQQCQIQSGQRKSQIHRFDFLATAAAMPPNHARACKQDRTPQPFEDSLPPPAALASHCGVALTACPSGVLSCCRESVRNCVDLGEFFRNCVDRNPYTGMHDFLFFF